MRHKYVMRAVSSQTQETFKYGVLKGEPKPYLSDILECGHIRPQEQIDSTADAIRIMVRSFVPNKIVKRRCYECAKGANT